MNLIRITLLLEVIIHDQNASKCKNPHEISKPNELISCIKTTLGTANEFIAQSNNHQTGTRLNYNNLVN